LVRKRCLREIRQGSFDEMYREIFAQMDSLGTKSWAAVAAEAGLPELEEFEACIQVPWGEFPRIATGKELGLSVGVGATPTVWINGKLLKRRSLQAFRQRATELGL